MPRVVVLMAERDVIHHRLRAIDFLDVDEPARTDLGEVMVFAVVI